jgi:hypothetical protein
MWYQGLRVGMGLAVDGGMTNNANQSELVATLHNPDGKGVATLRHDVPRAGGRVSGMREADAAMARMVRYYSHPDCPA